MLFALLAILAVATSNEIVHQHLSAPEKANHRLIVSELSAHRRSSSRDRSSSRGSDRGSSDRESRRESRPSRDRESRGSSDRGSQREDRESRNDRDNSDRGSRDRDSEDCVCTTEYIPLCCEGKTYSNNCFAACDGMEATADHAGLCTEGACDDPMGDPMNDPVGPTDAHIQSELSAHRRSSSRDQGDRSSSRDHESRGSDRGSSDRESRRESRPSRDRDSRDSSDRESGREDRDSSGRGSRDRDDGDSCICTREYIPLCCDGVTYGNNCMAACAGKEATADSAGVCTEGACDDSMEDPMNDPVGPNDAYIKSYRFGQ